MTLDEFIDTYQPASPAEDAAAQQNLQAVRAWMLRLGLDPGDYPTIRAMVGTMVMTAPHDSGGRALLATLSLLGQRARELRDA